MTDELATLRNHFLAAIELTEVEAQLRYAASLHTPELRTKLRAMLIAHQQSNGFLASHAATGECLSSPLDVPLSQGTQIGSYNIVEEIGHGGMGIVYLAEQQEPLRRTVALKIIKPGLDTRQVIARFEAERQTLARMDHPYIAKILDAGTTYNGRPYFVMELVRGVPITRYCDECELGIRQRLELFIKTCQAVSHAHQQGIIHRDIKPSNVLVAMHDGQPVPKVIDFGVAKAINCRLTEESCHTGFGHILGTPLYMPPEQAEMSPMEVDTRGDVYSLGVLLYELLTGSTPFTFDRLEAASADQIRQVLKYEEPPRPTHRVSTLRGDQLSTVAKQRRCDSRSLFSSLRHDLDWIVMKCLEKDRMRRYETPGVLAADIERHLRQQPVLAGSPSLAYRVTKLVRRRRKALAVIAVLVLVMIVWLGAGIWFLHERRLRHERTVAEFERALRDADVYRRASDWPRALAAAQRAVSLADVARDERLMIRGRQPLHDLELASQLDEIRSGVETDAAHATTRHAFLLSSYDNTFRRFGLDFQKVSHRELAQRIRSTTVRMPIADALDRWAWSLRRACDTCRQRYGRNRIEWRKLSEMAGSIDPDPLRVRIRRAWQQNDVDSIRTLANVWANERLPATTSLLLASALKDAGDSPTAVIVLRAAHDANPADYWLNKALGVALNSQIPPQFSEAVGYFRAAVALRPGDPASHINLGIALRGEGRLDEAVCVFRQAIELNEHASRGHFHLGNVLLEQQRPEEAIASYQRALQLRPDYPSARNNLGNALTRQGRLEEAIEQHSEAVRLEPDDACFRNNLAIALRKHRDIDEAIEEHRRALQRQPLHADHHVAFGETLMQAQQAEAAIAQYRKALAMDPMCGEAYVLMADTFRNQKRFEEAIAGYRSAIEVKPHEVDTHVRLGHVLLHDVGKPADAVASFRRAVELAPRSAAALNGLGIALVGLGNLAEGHDCLKDAVTIEPNCAGYLSDLATAMSLQGRRSESIEAYRRALQIDPSVPQIHANLGVELSRQGEHGEAIASLSRAMEMNAASVNHQAQVILGDSLAAVGRAHEARARYCRVADATTNAALLNYIAWKLATSSQPALRDPAEAVALARRAVQQSPDEANFLDTLGVALYRNGQWQEAITAFHDLLAQQDDDHANGLFFLAMSYRQMGDTTRAQEAFDRAVVWMDTHEPHNTELQRIREEAERLLQPF